jgi:hypothetical protein
MESKLRLSVTADPTGTPIDNIRVLLSEETDAGVVHVPTDVTDPRMNFQLAKDQNPSETPILMDVSYGKISFADSSHVRLHMIGYADDVPIVMHTGRLDLGAIGVVDIHLALIPERCDMDQDGFPDCTDGCCEPGSFVHDCQPTVAHAFPWSNAEQCDNLDNDCNGETDEGIEGIGDTCLGNAEDPQCRPSGLMVCEGGAPTCVTATNQQIDCNDGNACTQNDQCWLGACNQSSPVDCDDGDKCTIDSCDPETGCVHEHDPVCDCTSDEACSDGDACNGAEVCADDGDCKPGVIPNCDDGTPCTTDDCDKALGCTHQWNPNACECETDDQCNDGNVCNGVETCLDAFMCESTGPLVCDDNNVCTDDTCNPATGCVFTPNTLGCDDGNVCTEVDTCVDGNCIGTEPIVCTALDQCHDVGICDPDTGTCSNPALPNSSVCDDGNKCTDADTCQSGSCESDNQIVCNDDNVCTDDTCNPATGCVFTPNTLGCDDGNACTNQGACQNGNCQPGGTIVCNDGNMCTNDSCDPNIGCVFTNNTVPCDDEDACTDSDVCSAGVCTGNALTDTDGDGTCDLIDACDFDDEAVDGACAFRLMCWGESGCPEPPYFPPVWSYEDWTNQPPACENAPGVPSTSYWPTAACCLVEDVANGSPCFYSKQSGLGLPSGNFNAYDGL